MRNKLILLSFFLITALLLVESCQSEQQLNFARYYTNGRVLYEQHCQNCHSADGKGLAKLYPPLTDTLFLKDKKNSLACIIKYGINDSLLINGVVFTGNMPAEPNLANIDIAALVTYITNSFGNKQGLYDVDNAGVDIKACQRQDEYK